jgi:hypothetical protein
MSPSFESDEILSAPKFTYPNTKTSRGVCGSSGGFTFMAISKRLELCRELKGKRDCTEIRRRIDRWGRDVETFHAADPTKGMRSRLLNVDGLLHR